MTDRFSGEESEGVGTERRVWGRKGWMRVTGRPGLEEGRMGEKGGEERGLKRGWAGLG